MNRSTEHCPLTTNHRDLLHLGVAALVVVFVPQSLEDALRGVALLARSLAVGDERDIDAAVAAAVAAQLDGAEVVLLKHHGCLLVAAAADLAYQRAMNLEAAAMASTAMKPMLCR